MALAPDPAPRGIWTPANVVTLVRICLVPVFVVALLSPWPEWFGFESAITFEVKSLVAAGLFIVISCTDWLDGYLARSRGEVTDFGKFMDPLADKMLVMAALIVFVELGRLPAWAVLIVVVREFAVTALRLIAVEGGRVIAAGWSGKIKTASTMVCICLMLVITHSPALDLACGVVILATTIYSGIEYFVKNKDVIDWTDL